MAELSSDAQSQTVLLRDSVHRGQTKSGAGGNANRFSGEERFENPRENFGCDAKTGIGHSDFDILRGYSRSQDTAYRIGIGAEANKKVTLAVHRFGSIDDQVQQDLFKANLV